MCLATSNVTFGLLFFEGGFIIIITIVAFCSQKQRGKSDNKPKC